MNSDQTQVIYAPGDKMTYAPIRKKQVSLVGGDKKWVFTMVSIANNGTLLPFQAIYGGQSKHSHPSKNVPHYDDVLQAGMSLEYSRTKTYWSNH